MDCKRIQTLMLNISMFSLLQTGCVTMSVSVTKQYNTMKMFLTEKGL